jgi:hypothetical protein
MICEPLDPGQSSTRCIWQRNPIVYPCVQQPQCKILRCILIFIIFSYSAYMQLMQHYIRFINISSTCCFAPNIMVKCLQFLLHIQAILNVDLSVGDFSFWHFSRVFSGPPHILWGNLQIGRNHFFHILSKLLFTIILYFTRHNYQGDKASLI